MIVSKRVHGALKRVDDLIEPSRESFARLVARVGAFGVARASGKHEKLGVLLPGASVAGFALSDEEVFVPFDRDVTHVQRSVRG